MTRGFKSAQSSSNNLLKQKTLTRWFCVSGLWLHHRGCYSVPEIAFTFLFSFAWLHREIKETPDLEWFWYDFLGFPLLESLAFWNHCWGFLCVQYRFELIMVWVPSCSISIWIYHIYFIWLFGSLGSWVWQRFFSFIDIWQETFCYCQNTYICALKLWFELVPNWMKLYKTRWPHICILNFCPPEQSGEWIQLSMHLCHDLVIQ